MAQNNLSPSKKMNLIHDQPKNVMFVITSMPVGGAETLLVNMLHRFDPNRINPSVCCLKEKGVLGEKINSHFQVFDHLIHHKFDALVIGRLRKLFVEQKIDAVVTIGAGDKMFWGRLAARYAKIPVILSALHSTGWPDGVGNLNRLLTKITTGFIAVAKNHGQHLVDYEGFPAAKVHVIANGVDTEKFKFDPRARVDFREELRIESNSPVVGIVAALRPEKNHRLFVDAAAKVVQQLPDSRFIIVGDGPEKNAIEQRIAELGLSKSVFMIGNSDEIPNWLSTVDLFALTSDNEASPVSILEAMACKRPVVSTNVGSVAESVLHGKTGYLVPAGDLDQTVERWLEILSDRELRAWMGENARLHAEKNASLESMTIGYTELIENLYQWKTGKSVDKDVDLAAAEQAQVV